MSFQDRALTAAHAEVKAELARTDTKASLLLAFTGAMLAGAWTVATSVHLPPAAMASGPRGWRCCWPRPRICCGRSARTSAAPARRASPSGRRSPDEIRDALSEDDRPAHIAALSRIAVAKFNRLQRAIDLTSVAGALLVAAAVVAWLGVA
ncbi:integral membrane plasmid transfer protein [Streptomyces lydicus]|uniref:integral membrane plasmid transfer protein n=1 Tax=Streptomyces lydicus TaxID=47763 RepID=UPI00380B4E52